ncbi:DNA primase [Tumidithrix elongata RA019]|uniref:DNA primase n=1 Tax=Tumidithrix elongata BACA0141 TaxID=2716417 RepID=A0AAW9PQP0_9CYAN|nr:DNA primase [Tumidithrix elongata RA019]
MTDLRLHPDTKEQVRQKVDIVDVISEHIVLRKSGVNFRGACPFHNGSNPTALTVNPVKQIYHCFNCGASGDAFKFLMDIGKRSFQDVVLDLAKRHGVAVRTLEPEKAQELQRQLSHRDQIYEAMGLATSFYQHALFSSQGREAHDYLIQKRQLTKETIQTFQLGYAPAGWDTLYGYLVQQKRLPPALVEQAGLIVPRKGGGGYYDRFRDRLMIPIHDTRGRAIAFGGRSLGDEQPKYLNSPETELFSKGSILYAMDKARDAISKTDRAVVVEGYFDAIALHQAGIQQAVATMGVALSGDQMRQLLRYTESKHIILNFDADKAGITAAEKAIAGFKDLVFNGTVQLRILTMPDGKDADEYLKQHDANAYQELLTNAPLFIDWQIEQILAGQNLNQADQFQKCSQAITQLLTNLPDTFIRTHYIHTCAQRLAQGNSYLALRLEQDLRRQLRYSRWYGNKPQTPTTPTSALHVAETQLLQIYLHFPQHRAFVYEILETEDISFSMSNHRHLWQMILDMLEEETTSLEPVEPFPDHLVQQLQTACAEIPEMAKQLHHLLWLDENSRVALLRPTMVVKAAIAKIQLVMGEKRYRHWRDLWEKTDLKANPELGHYYQTKIQSERNSILELQKQIEVTFADLTDTLGLIVEF